MYYKLNLATLFTPNTFSQRIFLSSARPKNLGQSMMFRYLSSVFVGLLAIASVIGTSPCGYVKSHRFQSKL